MTYHAFLLSSFCLFNAITLHLLMTTTTNASNCNGPCQNQDDCAGQLICINGKCNDLQGATPTCGSSRARGAQSSCNSKGPHSPPIVPSGTRAILALNDFGPGGDGGVPPKCDDKYHPLPERAVALPTGWFDNRSRCGKMIRIEARNGKSVVAKVVDECDSVHGCDRAHGYQPPCKTNVVVASQTVWDDLELDTDKGEVAVIWSVAKNNDSLDD